METVKPLRIVIDPGHGGTDSGFNASGLAEKDFTLNLAGKLKDALIDKGYQVYMTRNSDVFLSLEDRAAYVSKHPEVAAFISLHANAAKKSNSSGIETFYFDTDCITHKESFLNKDDYAALMAHRKQLISESKRLAHALHDEIISYARDKYDVKDRKVRHGAAQVLLTAVPSVLIECGFLSNPQEFTLLADEKYQEGFAQAIVRGLKKFL